MASFSLFIIGTFVHTPQLRGLEILHNHVAGIDTNGFISLFEPKSAEVDALMAQHALVKRLDLPPSSFVTPTFVDTHLHAPQFLYLGTGLHLPLMEWLDQYAYKAEERMDADPILARRVYEKLCDRLIEAGTGAVLAFGTIKSETNLILSDVCQSKGIRGYVGKLSMDISSRPTYVEESSQVALDSISSFIDRCRSSVAHLAEHEQLVKPVITPRFVPTCSDELLVGLGNLSGEKQAHVQSHLAEARDQVDWVRNTRHAEDIDVFDRSELLIPRTVQAHCTFLDSPDLERLEAAGTAVAHCPLSNAYFSSKPFPLREALNLGVKVGLGSDVAGGYLIDIMSAMRSAVSTSRIRDGQHREQLLASPNENHTTTPTPGDLRIDWKEALFLGTRGGDISLGLNSGHFVLGAPFDAQLIKLVDESGSGVGALDFFDVNRETAATFVIDEVAVEKWWCLGDQRNRSGMWIQGKQLM